MRLFRRLGLLTCCFATTTTTAGARPPILLAPAPSSARYTLVREAWLGEALLSRSTQHMDVQVAEDRRGWKTTVTVRRVEVELATPGGTRVTIDTAREGYAKSENPMVREMTDGLGKILDVPLACIVQGSGRIVDQQGVAVVRESLPGRGRAPGLASQILMGVVRMVAEGHQVLPRGAVSPGESWSGTLSLLLGPGPETPGRVAFRLASVSADTASVAGVITIDPATITASEMGRPVGAEGTLAYTFDVAHGRYISRSSRLVIHLDSGAKGQTRLTIRNELTPVTASG